MVAADRVVVVACEEENPPRVGSDYYFMIVKLILHGKALTSLMQAKHSVDLAIMAINCI